MSHRNDQSKKSFTAFEADESRLLALLQHWQQQAAKVGHEIKRIVVAFEAGRDGFWLARWLRARGDRLSFYDALRSDEPKYCAKPIRDLPEGSTAQARRAMVQAEKFQPFSNRKS
jgi:hypothetical protein